MATPVRSMSSRAVQAERTRQQILETAQRLFTELGYDATSLQMIADEMGLTKAAVYYHFRAKNEILDAIMLPGVQRLKALLDDAAANAPKVIIRIPNAMIRPTSSGVSETGVRQPG